MRHKANLNLTIEGNMEIALRKMQEICSWGSLGSDPTITVTGVHIHQGYDGEPMQDPEVGNNPTPTEEPNDGQD